MSRIEIYQTPDKQTQIDVRFEEDTVWLTQQQMSMLFGQTKQNISLHINNCFKEKELDRKSVVKESLTTARDGKTYKTKNYNLDVIISVGYRVNSQKATRFRIWAMGVLKDHLVKGVSINQKRLKQLQQVVSIIQQSGGTKELSAAETKGLLEIITSYTQSFILLNRFDSNSLPEEKLNENITYEIRFSEATAAIEELKKQLVKKKEASDLFGRRKDESFAGILNSVVQTFDGKYLYKTVEEQAAHLLYFVIKNHPFTDGNNGSVHFCLSGFLKKINTGLRKQAS